MLQIKGIEEIGTIKEVAYSDEQITDSLAKVIDKSGKVLL